MKEKRKIDSFNSNWNCPHCNKLNDGSYQSAYMHRTGEGATIAQCEECKRIVNVYLNCFSSIVAEPVKKIEIPEVTRILKEKKNF